MGRHCKRSTCPFCECEYTDMQKRPLGGGRTRFYVACCGCGARGPEADDKEEATSLWNALKARLNRHGSPPAVLALVRS